MAKRQPMISDDTIRTCLERIRNGEMAAVGVLADYLEEHRKPRRVMVRKLWDAYHKYIAEFGDMPTAAPAIRGLVRGRIAQIYRMKWKPLNHPDN